MDDGGVEGPRTRTRTCYWTRCLRHPSNGAFMMGKSHTGGAAVRGLALTVCRRINKPRSTGDVICCDLTTFLDSFVHV